MKPDIKIDRDLVINISNGSEKSFEILYKAYFDEVIQYAYRYLDDKDHAFEIVQDVFVKLWEKRVDIIDIKSIKGYIYRSVYNAIVNYFKHQTVIRRHEDSSLAELKRIEMESFEDTFYNCENQEKLHEFIEELPQKNREVFKMKYFQEKKYREISKEMNITERTVETHIRNAIRELRSKFMKFMEKQYLWFF